MQRNRGVYYNRPAPQRRPPKGSRWKTWLRRIIVSSVLLFLTVAVIAVALVAFAWNTMSLPPERPLLQTSFLTDSSGNRLATLGGEEDRIAVRLDQISPNLRNAVLAVEDNDFYRHRGIDPRGIARALVYDVRNRGENLQGGSTLTQQYVKNQFAGSEQTLERKFREAILAIKLEQKFTKDEIFERYLNAIYMGRGTYGMQAASKAYFNKDAANLSVNEAAYLAGAIRGPEISDPFKSPETALRSRNLALDNMERFGYISAPDRQSAQAVPVQSYVLPRSAKEPTTVLSDKGTQYFVDYVRSALIQKYGERMVVSGGLRVKTTLDLELQARAYDSIYSVLRPGDPAGALVSVDNNGYIKAMVGGRDYKELQVNLAAGRAGGGSGRQAGSTMKPIGLAAALEQGGVTMNTQFPGPAKAKISGWGSDELVSNFDNEEFGRINLKEATIHSVNTVYAQLIVQEGANQVSSMAKRMGVADTVPRNNSIILGAVETSPLQMAEAYMTFGQRGLHIRSTPVLSVQTADGKDLKWGSPQRAQVMSQKTADFVNDALQGVVQRGTGRAAGVGNKPIAGKTGTTDDNGDAWFVGYTPNLATAVWMGYPEGSQRKMSNLRGIEVTGGSFPARMFSNYMGQALRNVDVPNFATTSTSTTTTTEAELNDLEQEETTETTVRNRRGNSRDDREQSRDDPNNILRDLGLGSGDSSDGSSGSGSSSAASEGSDGTTTTVPRQRGRQQFAGQGADSN